MAKIEKRPITPTDLIPYQRSVFRLKTSDTPGSEIFIGKTYEVTIEEGRMTVRLEWIARERKASLPMALQPQEYAERTLGLGARFGYLMTLDAVERKEWVNGEKITLVTARGETVEFCLSPNAAKLAENVRSTITTPS